MRNATRRRERSRVARAGIRGRARTGQLALGARTARSESLVRRSHRRSIKGRTPTGVLGCVASRVGGNRPTHDPWAQTAAVLVRGWLSRPAGTLLALAPDTLSRRRNVVCPRIGRRRRCGSRPFGATTVRRTQARVCRGDLSRDAARPRPQGPPTHHRHGRPLAGGADRVAGSARVAGRRRSGPTTRAVRRVGNLPA